MSENPFEFRRIALVGLGVGTLATYLRADQHLDIYELDPDVEDIARDYFTFLKFARGTQRVVIGDGRLQLEQARDQRYDLVILDAFNGDSIPVHLLTKEAVEIYQQRIQDDGLLLFQVTNRYVNLGGVLSAIARELGARACYKITPGQGVFTRSSFIALTWDNTVYDRLVGEFNWVPLHSDGYKFSGLWTDDHNSLMGVFRFDAFFESIYKKSR